MSDPTNASPSADPGDLDSLLGTFRIILQKFLQGVDDMLPCRVVAFNGDRENPRVTVVPLVALVTTAGDIVQRAQISSVPVMQPGAGGVVLLFNIQPGDLGWIKANDRDISLFAQSMDTAAPNTKTMHSFEHGVFIPDSMRGWTVAGEDADAAVLQSLDGSTRLSINGSRVKMVSGSSSVTVSPAGVAIEGVLTINGQPYLGHVHDLPGGGTTLGVHV